jgi:8-oxo-dGTP pyrophosphatase MutT (NUDIX family)
MKCKVYRGAVLLIMAFLPDKRKFILLGKRKHRPCPGTWSFPGGRKEPEDVSFPHTALREAMEEIWLPQLKDMETEKLDPVFSRNLIFFRWITYGVVIKCYTLPAVGIRHEFSNIEWYSRKQLPKPLHWGVNPAIRRAMKKSLQLRHINSVYLLLRG